MLCLIRSALYLKDVQTNVAAALFAITKDWKLLRYSSDIKRNKVKKKLVEEEKASCL